MRHMSLCCSVCVKAKIIFFSFFFFFFFCHHRSMCTRLLKRYAKPNGTNTRQSYFIVYICVTYCKLQKIWCQFKIYPWMSVESLHGEQVESCQLLVVNCDNTRLVSFLFISVRFIYACWGGRLRLQTTESVQFLLHHQRLRRDFGCCNCSRCHLAARITLFAISEPNEKLSNFCVQIMANIPYSLSHLMYLYI